MVIVDHPLAVPLVDAMHLGEVCMDISLYAGVASAVQLHRACNVADEVGVRSLRRFLNLTIHETIEKWAYARRWIVWAANVSVNVGCQ